MTCDVIRVRDEAEAKKKLKRRKKRRREKAQKKGAAAAAEGSDDEGDGEEGDELKASDELEPFQVCTAGEGDWAGEVSGVVG